jgi:cyclopropane-fatty-acyl-phospholipid synthase
MEAAFDRLTRLMERPRHRASPSADQISFAIRDPDGRSRNFGAGAPAFTVVVKNANGLAALSTGQLMSIAEAYMVGNLDVEGDLLEVFKLRTVFSDSHPLKYAWRFVRPLLFGQVKVDRESIAAHYDYEQDFYLLFLDPQYRCYSQAIFERDDEPIERAMQRKLDFALESVGVRPGDRVLDIGGGWGAFSEYAGKRGIRVTSLTISRESENFVRGLIEKHSLPCEIRFEHFMEHRVDQPYDAIVNLGVTEHLPDYAGTLRQYLALVKPGGRVYLDASASRVKNDHSAFLERYIYPGNGSLLCLHEYLAEVALTPLQLLGVWDDRHSYGLTTRAWAENLDRNRAEIERRWGSPLYRKFQLYLWGCVDAFDRDLVQAYRLVLQRPAGA